MKPLRLVPAASAELRAAARWYERKESGLGDSLLMQVDLTLEKIRRAPHRYALWKAGFPFRKLRVDRFPYLVFYETRTSEIRVHAVAHTKRKPGYWLSRAQ